ncbi:zinc ribbon domain-containing protein [Natronococcus jeotgali]|uniref:DUF7575 domain-containing protein n=1 Tax=Natronococcus jeotgali DSM 18795 TaxID=1227498 RepID=L9X4K3_9EURY|nr:zinc ribbon domain-containing protein [Natronococcus jeotgali]ELY56401.1 hypothetical protein C492_14906 [Natronococcus jeotgali DSM 18795]
MSQTTSRKRPWLAALLAALVTGLGHLYLRRLRRAVGWLLASLVVTTLFVDQGAFQTLIDGTVTLETVLAVAPMYAVIGLSVLDAYRIARTPTPDRRSAAQSADGDATTSCPHCGKELDDDLEFCHWCTTPLGDDVADESATDAPEDSHR